MKKFVHFSPTEQRLIEILEQEPEPISTTDLVSKFYRGRRKPTHAATSLLTVIGRVAKKTQRYEPFRLRKSIRCGPYPIQVWLDRRAGAPARNA